MGPLKIPAGPGPPVADDAETQAHALQRQPTCRVTYACRVVRFACTTGANFTGSSPTVRQEVTDAEKTVFTGL